ncbi:hypothetical protein L1987_84301 [Smallanthus sonchifolius]|uniref:Uncharacterized protein n=1 Tax=Smallanthus sonchifolius TaxID=185202 RepID=A0ACB8YF11_9ASTR|nr:hypothetical protein L1987_84301 [Smallanthus sonchifolius]
MCETSMILDKVLHVVNRKTGKITKNGETKHLNLRIGDTAFVRMIPKIELPLAVEKFAEYPSLGRIMVLTNKSERSPSGRRPVQQIPLQYRPVKQAPLQRGRSEKRRKRGEVGINHLKIEQFLLKERVRNNKHNEIE